MKKFLKKAMASAVAGVTLAVGMTAMSSSAYSTTKTIYNSAGSAVGKGYCSVSSTSAYATTTRYNVNHYMTVSIDSITGNHYVNGDESGYSSNYECYKRCYGSNLSEARSSHVVNGYSTSIVMNAG